MTNQDWLYRVSAPILAASAAANLQGPEKKIANGYAWLAAKHKQLDLMEVSDAKKQFELLDSNVQESLKSMFADAPYLQEDPSFLSKVWDAATAPLETAWNALGSYGEALSNPFRMMITGQSWDATFDGKKIFDKNLEKQTDAAYTAEVSKIAKSISTGMGFGEVLATLSTDAEFEAFQRFAQGDETIQNAIRDYDNAKISWGRSFARMFGLSPDIGKKDQGVEGTVYNILSGTADIVGDVIFDPLTYVAAPIKAIQVARFGLLSLARAEVGALSTTQKAIGLLGFKNGFDAAFEVPRIRKAYDTVGPMIQQFKNADAVGRAKVIEEIQKIQPSMDIETIRQLSLAGVKDADSALRFFKDSDSVERILNGKVGEMQPRLAKHTAMTDATIRIRAAANEMLGISAGKLPQIEVDDALQNLIDHGTEIHTVLRAKEIKSFGDKYTRLLERAFVNRSVYVGGEDQFGRALNASSASTIYSLARTFLPKYHAKTVANLYASTTDYAASRNIVRGLFDSIAEHLGIPEEGAIRKMYEAEIKKWADPTYSETFVVDAELSKATGLAQGTLYHPGMVDGRQLAVAGNQITDKVVLPDLARLARLGTKNNLAGRVSRTVQSELVSGVTDFWSALNLLPRLGIRSVLDETIMQGLVLPISLFDDLIRGYQRSVTERVVTSSDKATKIRFVKKVKDANGNDITKTVLPFADEKSIGVVARALRPFFANVTDADRALAGRGAHQTASVISNQLEKAKASWFTRMSEKDREYINDNIKFGHSNEIRNLGEGITESLNAGTVEDIPSMMTARYNLNVQQINKDLQVTFGNKPTIITKGGNDYIANFFIQMNDRIDRNGFVGELAVKYMKDPQRAIREIANHLRTDGAEYYSRFDRSRLVKAGTRSVEQDATDMYLHVRKLFYSDTGEFNDELYKLVRKGGKVDTTAITLEDYGKFADKLPQQLMGFAERKVGYRKLPDFISDIFDRGFQIADRQIATLTREPVYTAYNLHYRRQLQPLQDKFIKEKIAQGWSESAAKEIAGKRYAALGHELSLNRMIGYIDNPNVRSVMALNARNVARYYRANEDFARRAARVLKDPQALVRLRMSLEGLDHSGFIHEDENGDKYFSIPVDEVMYPVYAQLMQFLGQKPMQMMPLDFTGKLKMLTPSADPESWTPTFAGPFMSMGVGAVSQMLNRFGHPEIADALNTGLLGKYAENKDFIDAITPTVLKRSRELLGATFDPQAESEQITSAFFKSAAFYTSNGMGLGPDSTLAEREQFMRDVTATARNVVAIRNLLGIWSPVSPSISETVDVPQHMLDLDMTSWRSEFRSLVEAEIAKGSPTAYDDALSKWTKLFPGKLVYTVPETELDTVASVKKTKQAVAWIKDNRPLVEAHRQGSTFLMPQMNAYDIDAYAFLKREGYIKSKTMDQYLEDIANVNAENEYFDMRDSFKKQVESAATVEQARSLSAGFEQQLQAFKDQRPFLKLALEHNSTGNQLKLDVLTDTRDMLQSGLVPKSSTSIILQKMIQEYDTFRAQYDSISSQSDSDAAFKNRLRADAASRIAEIAGINPNALAFYNTILKRLIEG